MSGQAILTPQSVENVNDDYSKPSKEPNLERVVADLLVERYQVDVAGAYQAVLCVVTDAFAEKRGAILLTSGGFALYPTADYLPLSMDKATLRAMGRRSTRSLPTAASSWAS